MLNIINLLKKNNIIRIFNKKGENIRIHKRDIPLNKEWYNSLYVFSKNSIRFLPAVHENLFKLLNRYFNMHNKNFKTKAKSHDYEKVKRTLNNKVWVSTPEIKHLNEKIVITVYIFNRLYNKYKEQLNDSTFLWGPNFIENKDEIINEDEIVDKDIKVRKNTKKLIFRHNICLNSNKSFYLKLIKWLKLDKYIRIQQQKSYILNLIKNNNNLLKGLKNLKLERYHYLINQFKLELLYLKFKQKMLFNQFKFNELYLNPLIELLQMIYKKKIEFNIVTLKYYFLSSSILSQIIVAKAKSKKNRGQASRPLMYALEDLSIPNLSGNKLKNLGSDSIGMQNIILNQYINSDIKNDSLDLLLFNNTKSKLWSSDYVDNLAVSNVENKSVAGVFIKITGRLTKRYKAQRAINVLKSKGTLKNVYSAHRGFSSALSRGYVNINVEKTIIHSKIRIGAFGVTGWISSC